MDRARGRALGRSPTPRSASSSSGSGPRPRRRSPLLNQLADWLDDRTGYRALVHEALDEPIPGGARWRYVFGSALSTTFLIQLVTGLLLMITYSPSSSTAWGSVYYISDEMTLGWFIRGIHHFGSQAMIVLLALHLLQVLWAGAYRRAPRGQLVVRHGPAVPDPGLQPDRLSAPLGPEGLLGDQGRHQHHGRGAGASAPTSRRWSSAAPTTATRRSPGSTACTSASCRPCSSSAWRRTSPCSAATA